MRIGFSLCLTSALVGLASCSSNDSSTPDPRLEAVERQIAAAQSKLEAVRKEVAAAEARAEAARIEAEFQACRAQVKEIRAEVERQRAQCAKDLADRNLCMARNSERTATGGLLGCGFGIAVAALSGGSATPWALGGCAVGAGAGALSEDACPSATCAAALDAIEPNVLSERKLTGVPRCGGYLGLELRDGRAVVAQGLRVDRVNPGTYGDSANIAVGDIVIAIDGAPTGTLRQLEAVLRQTREGQPLTVGVVRGDRLFKLTAAASRRTGEGDFADAVKLGVRIGPTVPRVQYRFGVVAESVVAGGPADKAGVQVGDQLQGVGVAGSTKGVASAGSLQLAEVEAVLGDLRPTATVEMQLVRQGRPMTATAHLGPRNARAEL